MWCLAVIGRSDVVRVDMIEAVTGWEAVFGSRDGGRAEMWWERQQDKEVWGGSVIAWER